MNSRVIRVSALVFLALSLSGRAAATGDDPACIKGLKMGGGKHDFIVIPSDRVPGEAEKYREYVKELVEPGGVIEKLGIRMTGQIVEFMQPRDLNAATEGSAGGYPASHYLDGA